jgi:hypothetical protein
MNKVIEEIVPWVELLENVIYDHTESPSEFEKEFCDGNELTDIWFSSVSMLVVYLLSSGEHVQTTYTLEALSSWLSDDGRT